MVCTEKVGPTGRGRLRSAFQHMPDGSRSATIPMDRSCSAWKPADPRLWPRPPSGHWLRPSPSPRARCSKQVVASMRSAIHPGTRLRLRHHPLTFSARRPGERVYTGSASIRRLLRVVHRLSTPKNAYRPGTSRLPYLKALWQGPGAGFAGGQLAHVKPGGV